MASTRSGLLHRLSHSRRPFSLATEVETEYGTRLRFASLLSETRKTTVFTAEKGTSVWPEFFWGALRCEALAILTSDEAKATSQTLSELASLRAASRKSSLVRMPCNTEPCVSLQGR